MSDGSGSGSDGESEGQGPRRRTEERDGNGSMWSHLTAMREDVNSLTKIVTKFVKIVEGKAQAEHDEHDAAEEVESGVKKRKSRGATAIKESLKRSGISSWTDADQIAVREYVNMRIPILISLLFR